MNATENNGLVREVKAT